MDGEQYVRNNADTDAHTNTNANAHAHAHANANANANPDANPDADANFVRALGGREDLHRWAGCKLSRCFIHGAGNPHRVRRD